MNYQSCTGWKIPGYTPINIESFAIWNFWIVVLSYSFLPDFLTTHLRRQGRLFVFWLFLSLWASFCQAVPWGWKTELSIPMCVQAMAIWNEWVPAERMAHLVHMNVQVVDFWEVNHLCKHLICGWCVSRRVTACYLICHGLARGLLGKSLSGSAGW